MTKSGVKPRLQNPHRVVALIYDGLCAFEFGIVAEIFGLSRPELGAALYDFQSVALEPGPLRLSGGLTVNASGSMAALSAAETLIIPGWRGKEAVVPETICSAIQAAHARGARILTICSGVYPLAAAGLLDGKTATTHWRYAADLAAKYPNITVKANALYVEDGAIITSAGSSAGIDACLHLVRQDYGDEIANSVARRLVMHAHRQGDQAQYIERPVPKTHEAHRLSTLLDDIRKRLGETHSVKSMSEQAGMSPRTFQRRFAKLTGLSPKKWVISERLHQARLLLETTGLPIDDISVNIGFHNTESLRYHFRQSLDISPMSYRKRFVQRAAI